MFDSFRLAIPASTLRTAPAVRDVSLPSGIITWVGIRFPINCAGLAHVRILRSGHQLWPTDPDEDIAANGQIVSWDERYPLLDPPYTLRLEGWNDDDTYPHNPTVFFEVAGPPPSPAAPASQSLLDRLRALVTGAPVVPSPPAGEG